MKKTIGFSLLALGASMALPSHASVSSSGELLFLETFDSVVITDQGSDPRRYGAPTTTAGGSDNDWFGARFAAPLPGGLTSDIGLQLDGGGGNSTSTGFAEDNAGLMFSVDTSLYENIMLEFDWRAASDFDTDALVVGYFVGDLDAGHPEGFNDRREIDLRTIADGGPADGAWNWDAGWNELARLGPSDTFSSAFYDLADAAGESDVWIAFWMNGPDGEVGKFDNIAVTGTLAPVPVPAAVWLFGSALLGFAGIRRRS